MKTPLIPVAVLLTLALIVAACGSGDDAELAAGNETNQPAVDPTPANPDDSETNVDESNRATDPTENVVQFWVGPELRDCIGEAAQKCMLIKRTANGPEEFFYDQIEGFTYVEGTSYVLDVAITDVEDPPADASSLAYRLVSVVSSEAAGSDGGRSDGTAGQTAPADVEGIEWSLESFGPVDNPIVVIADTEITLMLAAGQAAGTSSCNRFTGSYTLDDTGIGFGPLASTRMACPQPIMAQEGNFLATMQRVDSVSLDDYGRLVLTTTAGESLTFTVD